MNNINNLQELYDYVINTYGSPEQALKAILYHNMDGYEDLKKELSENRVDVELEGHPLVIITMASFELGWDIAVEGQKENVRGLSVGTSEYINDLFGTDESDVTFEPDPSLLD